MPRDALCDSELVKVVEIATEGPSWVPMYSTSTTYKTPSIIADVVGNTTRPMEGWSSNRLKGAFDYRTRETSVPEAQPVVGEISVGKITGCIVGAVGGLALIVTGLWLFRRYRAVGGIDSGVEVFPQDIPIDGRAELECPAPAVDSAPPSRQLG